MYTYKCVPRQHLLTIKLPGILVASRDLISLSLSITPSSIPCRRAGLFNINANVLYNIIWYIIYIVTLRVYIVYRYMRVFIILYIRDTFLIIYSLAPLLSMLFFFFFVNHHRTRTYTHTHNTYNNIIHTHCCRVVRQMCLSAVVCAEYTYQYVYNIIHTHRCSCVTAIITRPFEEIWSDNSYTHTHTHIIMSRHEHVRLLYIVKAYTRSHERQQCSVYYNIVIQRMRLPCTQVTRVL